MRRPAMAHATLRDSPRPLGRVLLVTVQTAHLSLVFPSTGFYGLRLLGVAQDTLGIRQGWDRCRSLPYRLFPNRTLHLSGAFT